jgi:hypothetical protein
MKKINILYLFLIMLLSSMQVDAQATSDSIPDLPSDEVQVLKKFQAKTKTYKPVTGSPTPIEKGSKKLSFDYKVDPPIVALEKPSAELRPLAYTNPLIKNNKDGFVDISFGNPSSPKLDYGYHYNIEDWYEVGLIGSYFSADDNVIELRDFMSTNHKLYGGYNLNKSIKVNADVAYMRDKRFFFNTMFSELPSNEDILKNTYNNLNFGLNSSLNYMKEIGLNFNVGGNYDRILFSEKDIQEQHINAFASAEKSVGKHFIELRSSFNRYNQTHNQDSTSIAGNVWNVAGAFRYKPSKKLNIRLGASYYKQSDLNVIMPKLDASYALNKIITLKAGIDNNFQTLDLNNLFQINKFTEFTTVDTLVSNYSITPYLAVKANIKSHNLLLSGRYNLEKNRFFYELSGTDNFGLDLHYFDTNYFTAALDYNYQWKNTTVGFTSLYNFNTINEVYFPDWELGLTLGQALFSKIHLDVTYLMRDNRAFTINNTFLNENEILTDLNISGTYQITKLLQINTSVNNILNQEYHQWLGYPSYGRTYRAGAFIKF